MEFKKGDVVRIKEWDELVEEFGFNESGHINCMFLYTNAMEEAVDRTAYYKIVDIREKGEVDLDANPFEPLAFMVSTDMLAPVDGEVEAVEEKRVKRFRALNFEKDDCDFNNNVDCSISEYKHFSFTKMVAALLADPSQDINVKFRVYQGRYGDVTAEEVIKAFEGAGTGLLIINTIDNFEEKRDECAGFKPLEEKEDYGIYEYRGIIYAATKRSSNYFSDEFVIGLLNAIVKVYDLKVADDLLSALLDFRVNDVQRIINSYMDQWLKEKDEREFNNFVSNLETNLKDSKKDTIRASINSWQTKINDLENSLRSAYENLEAQLKEEAFLNSGYIKSDFSDFMTMLRKDRKNIRTPRLYEGRGMAELVILQDLLYFSDEDWEIVKKNTLEGPHVRRRVGFVLNAIFERKCTVIFETKVRINFKEAKISSPQRDYYTTVGIPNPHMFYYDCWGSNKHFIVDALRRGEYDTAYCQIKSALSGINVTDTPVMTSFISLLTEYEDHNVPCIRDNETEKLMTIKEAEEYYKEG